MDDARGMDDSGPEPTDIVLVASAMMVKHATVYFAIFAVLGGYSHSAVKIFSELSG